MHIKCHADLQWFAGELEHNLQHYNKSRG